MNLYVWNVDIEGASMLPDCGPEDRTLSWISKLPAATDDQMTTETDIPTMKKTNLTNPISVI